MFHIIKVTCKIHWLWGIANCWGSKKSGAVLEVLFGHSGSKRIDSVNKSRSRNSTLIVQSFMKSSLHKAHLFQNPEASV